MSIETRRNAGAARVEVPARSRRRRVIETLAFVAVWVILGSVLRLDSEAYLLLGVPLTVAFQLLVRRRPLRELWVRTGSRVTASRRGWALGALLAAAPAWFGTQALGSGNWALMGWWSAAVVGAAIAGFTLQTTRLTAVLRAAALPTAIGAGALAIGAVAFHLIAGVPIEVPSAIGVIAKYLAVYFPLTFVLEEVTFRGALDAHLQHPGEGGGRWSALLVSAVWGLWHLPISHGMPLPLFVGELIGWHVLVGVPLSLAWRRSGNLAGPALAHAAIDAVRNGLMLSL
jgi:Type II CAAX prenyl endopeptidase Rce1-like